MAFDKELVAAKLRRWEKYLREYRLPEWDRLPDLGLYMEQVTVLMRQYLDYLPPELKEEQFITASTINNYVRMKIMPEPRRKRYYRIHLAYLIVILTHKQSLSITMIRDLLPPDQPEEEMEAFYRMYTARHRIVSEYFVQQVRAAAGSILDHEQPSQTAVENASDLIIASAMVGGLTRLLAEKLFKVVTAWVIGSPNHKTFNICFIELRCGKLHVEFQTGWKKTCQRSKTFHLFSRQ